MKKHLSSVIKLRKELLDYAQFLTDYNLQLAHELLQATMQQIIKRSVTYNPVVGFISWAKTVMDETYIATVKTNDIQRLRRQCHCGSSRTSVLCSGCKYSIREAVYIMSKLSPQQAAVVTLRLLGYSHSQIAYKMNVTARSVKTCMLQARGVFSHVWDN